MKRNRVMAILCGMMLSGVLFLSACGEASSSRGTRPRDESSSRDDDDEDEDEDDEDEKEENEHNGGGNGNDEERPEKPEEPKPEPKPDEPKPDTPTQTVEYTGISFNTKDLDGNPITAEEIFSAHEYTMVNVWASWCGPCASEIPELADLSREFEEKDCAIVGILIDGDDRYGLAEAKDILQSAGATYLNLMPPSNVDNIFPSEYVPTSFFVDRSGNIVGEPIVGADPQGYERQINALLGNR